MTVYGIVRTTGNASHIELSHWSLCSGTPSMLGTLCGSSGVERRQSSSVVVCSVALVVDVVL